MKANILLLFILLFSMSLKAQPLALHPQNPHYFKYQGKPLLLISSAEHYGAVINGAFDYKKYLETLHAEGMNYTRIFTGTYLEVPGASGIGNNVLAPKPRDLVSPWVQTNEPGLFVDENKYDLDKWNEAYFDRLMKFVREAERLDIIVEVTFFSSNYSDKYWPRNPFNSENSVNDLPVVDRKEVHTLRNGKTFHYQKALVKKIVTELNAFNNVIYEIQNEPWSDQTTEGILIHKTLVPGGNQGHRMSELATEESLEWQKLIAEHIVETERNLPQKHLIAQNYCNMYYPLAEVDPNISILNFHYAWSEAALQNYGWELPISFDESGFSEQSGLGDTTYLRQAWEFILAGGAVFNNLDYSFYCGYEDGTMQNKAPGGGSKTFRKQLVFLHEFMNSFNFLKMKPDCEVVYHAPGMRAQALSEDGKQYALVFTDMKQNWCRLGLPEGEYQFEFISPFSGETLKKGNFSSDENTSIWQLPEQADYMVALKIIKK